MCVEKIKSEILKENPDWLLISTLAKEIYENSLETNALNFKKGVLNIIRCGEWDVHDIKEELMKCFHNNDYNFIIGEDVRQFNKWIKEEPNLFDKYHVILTSKNQIPTNASLKGIDCKIYKATIFNKYNKEKETKFTIKGDNINISFGKDGLRQEIRSLTLAQII